MFKKRFGVTPVNGANRTRLKPDAPLRNQFSRMTSGISVLLLLLGIFFPTEGFSQTNSGGGDTPEMARARAALYQKMAEAQAEERNSLARSNTEAMFGKVHRLPPSTNAGPHFTVDKYLVSGNTLLAPGIVGGILTNVAEAFGTNVNFEGIQAALGDLQMAYRERGYVTVSVGLPAGQKLSSSNTTVKVKVTEAPLAAINVTGNRWFSEANVRRALPSLHTNMLLNSHVFQRELKFGQREPQPPDLSLIIGPGPEPGTSALTLKVKDTFPMHGSRWNSTTSPHPARRSCG